MGVKSVKRRLSIQFEVGVTPSGRTAKASFSIPRLKEGVSEEKIRSVVAQIEEIMDCPVLGARIVEVITHEILGPVVHAREDEGEEVLTSLEGKRRVQEEATVGAVQSGVQESGVRMQQTRVGVPELPALMRLPVQSPLGLDAYPFKPSTKPGVLWERGSDGLSLQELPRFEKTLRPSAQAAAQGTCAESKDVAKVEAVAVPVGLDGAEPVLRPGADSAGADGAEQVVLRSEPEKGSGHGGKKPFLSRLHDFFVDDDYKNWTPVPEKVKKEKMPSDMSHIDWSKVSPVSQLLARYEAERTTKGGTEDISSDAGTEVENAVPQEANDPVSVLSGVAAEKEEAVSQEANNAVLDSEEENVPDLSHLVKDWDWSKPRPWQTQEDAKASPDFMTQMRANDYTITEDQLDRLLSWSPHDMKNTEAYKNHITPFRDLDPLIYGEDAGH